MKNCTLNDCLVDIAEVDYDYEMAMVIEAYYTESDIALTEDECIQLEAKYQEELMQEHYESMVDYYQDSLER